MAKSKLTQSNFEAIRDHVFDRIHETGEQLKNDLPNLLRTAIQTEIWKHFTDSDGKPFKGLVAWLHSPWPNGPGMGHGMHAVNYQDALQLTESASDVVRVLKSQGAQAVRSEAPIVARSKTKSNRDTLLARLEREAPNHYKAYLRGEHPSPTAAAIAAGILKDNQNLHRAKSAFRQMTAPQRVEFLDWLKTRKSTS